MDEDEEGELYAHETDFSSSKHHSDLQERFVAVNVEHKLPHRVM